MRTVSEHARLTRKSKAHVRRLVASGAISGMKIGNAWVILEPGEREALLASGSPSPVERALRSARGVEVVVAAGDPFVVESFTVPGRTPKPRSIAMAGKPVRRAVPSKAKPFTTRGGFGADDVEGVEAEKVSAVDVARRNAARRVAKGHRKGKSADLTQAQAAAVAGYRARVVGDDTPVGRALAAARDVRVPFSATEDPYEVGITSKERKQRRALRTLLDNLDS